MGNLLGEWTLGEGSSFNNGVYSITDGRIHQTIAVNDLSKLKLSYNCLEKANPKSYFLMKTQTLGKIYTYLLPVLFLGEDFINVKLKPDTISIYIQLIGSLEIKDISLEINDALSNTQREAIDKVQANSEWWDRIFNVTNEQGNLITSRLEGQINTALNNIVGANGKVTTVDGTTIYRDGATDEESTWAMMLGPAGFAIASGKDAQGQWIWSTFGTGEGFVADFITAGTLSAITIDGVDITGTNITGGTITGAVIQGGTTEEGELSNYKITGSTVIGGDEQGIHTLLSPNTPFQVRSGDKILAEIWGFESGGSSRFRMFMRTETTNPEKLEIAAGGSYVSQKINDANFAIRVTGGDLEGKVAVDTDGGFEVRAYDSGTINPLLRISAAGDCAFGKHDRFTDISGDTKVYGDFSVTGATKQAVVKTDNYGWRSLYCEESDRLYFNTKGISETSLTIDDKYQKIIRLGEVFLQTIEPNSICPYIINLTAYSDARVWVKAVYDKYVIVESDKPTQFAYNVQCTRRYYKDTYIEEVDMEARRNARKEGVTNG